MSGLEIVGVVLGALPLVISALERYEEGANTAKRYWRYKTELRSLGLQVQTEHGIFIDTLEQLLTGIVRAEHMSDVVASTGGDAWQRWGIDDKLRDRLGGAYEIYVDNVEDMNSALDAMKVKLALDPDGQPQCKDTSLFKQEFQRLKFSISKSEYSVQITHLRNHNRALTQLTKQSLDLEPWRTRSKARPCPNFKALQELARTLYDTLASNLANSTLRPCGGVYAATSTGETDLDSENFQDAVFDGVVVPLDTTLQQFSGQLP